MSAVDLLLTFDHRIRLSNTDRMKLKKYFALAALMLGLLFSGRAQTPAKDNVSAMKPISLHVVKFDPACQNNR